MAEDTQPQLGAFIAKLGSWLQLAQLVGIAGTIVRSGARPSFAHEAE